MFLAGNNLHALWDRDEPRYSVATREMVQTGDYIVPHFNGQVRYDKPILIYWLMAGPMVVFGENEFAMRFASGVMGAFRAVLIALLAMRMGAGRVGGFVAGILGALIPLLLVISKAATTDSTLVFFVLAALFFYWEQHRLGFSWSRHVLFWVMVALTALVKGPVGLAIIGFTIIWFEVWNRIWPAADATDAPPPQPLATRFAHLIAGLVVFCIVGMPWVVAVWLRTDGEFIQVSLGKHVVERSRTMMEGHGGPPVYYLPILLVTTVPFSALLLQSGVLGFRRRGHRAHRFLWSWIVPSFIMFSVVSTKLPHYIAPLIPAVAIMGGLWWNRRVTEQHPAERGELTAGWLGSGLTVLVGLALLIGVPVAKLLMEIPLPLYPGIAVGLLFTAGAVTGGLLWKRGLAAKALAAWCSGWIAAVLVAMVVALPYADAIRPSRAVGLWLRENAPADARFVMMTYDEPTLVFYGGRQFMTLGRRERAEGFAMLNDPNQRVALVTTRRRWDDFRGEWQGEVAPNVTIRMERTFYYFEKGEPITLLVIGNW